MSGSYRHYGNYTEKCRLRIYKRYIPLLILFIDLLISNNFSSMTFFCAPHILRVIGRRLYDSQPIFYRFFCIKKNKKNKKLLNKYKIN